MIRAVTATSVTPTARFDSKPSKTTCPIQGRVPVVTDRHCIGFTDSTFTVPCPEPVTSEVRTQRGGVWATWKPMCDHHADSAVDVLSQTAGWAVQRRPLCPDCANFLAGKMRGLGVDITVSTVAPAVTGPYTTEPFACPHGVTYWIEPTGEQIAAWAQDGVR